MQQLIFLPFQVHEMNKLIGLDLVQNIFEIPPNFVYFSLPDITIGEIYDIPQSSVMKPETVISVVNFSNKMYTCNKALTYNMQ